MRIVLAGAAGAMIASLAGCGPGSAFDNGMRGQFRDTAVESCIASSRAQSNTVRLDWPRLCRCAVDRYMANKTTSELQSTEANDPALREASRQCAMEQLNPGGGGSKP
jgi:hypothetical protein